MSMISIYYCDTSHVKDSEVEIYQRFLPQFVINDITSFKLKQDRKARFLGKLMLVGALKNDNSLSMLDKLEKTKFNKPFIKGWKNFSITHSDTSVLLSISDYEVGVDTERNRSHNYFEYLDFFSSKEQKQIVESKNKQCEFLNIWVKKESLFKAIGTGIADSNFTTTTCIESRVHIYGKYWHFYEIPIPDYTTFVCSPLSNCKIEYFSFDPKIFLPKM